MTFVFRILLVVALCSWGTVGESEDRYRYFIERRISFGIANGREVPLLFRIHIAEEPKGSVAAFAKYYDLHSTSIEKLFEYVEKHVTPMQAIQSPLWATANGQLYTYNIHRENLNTSVDWYCRGLMLHHDAEVAKCIADITIDITYQCNFLTADFEKNRNHSLQLMGVWNNIRGITVINPPTSSMPLYWELPALPEAALIPPGQVSVHVVIATTGNNNRIFGMIASLQDLTSLDFLTILFDGTDRSVLLRDILAYAELLLDCTVLHRIEPKALGYWGHAIRNTIGDLPGHFVWHVDDDDVVLPGALEYIKDHCEDANSLYLFRMRNANMTAAVWKEKDVLSYGGIGTPNGLIPTFLNKMGMWGLHYGGDFDFYASIVPFARNVVFVDHCIYRYFKL